MQSVHGHHLLEVLVLEQGLLLQHGPLAVHVPVSFSSPFFCLLSSSLLSSLLPPVILPPPPIPPVNFLPVVTVQVGGEPGDDYSHANPGEEGSDQLGQVSDRMLE